MKQHENIKSLATEVSHHLRLPSEKAQTQAKTNEYQSRKDNDQYVEQIIRSRMQQSFSDNKLSRKLKCKSLVTLNHSSNRKAKNASSFLKQRFNLTKEQVQGQIKTVQNQCIKFGGAQYIRDQMNKQKIGNQTLRNFYHQRITSIHGSLSLPKIQLKGGSQSDRNNLAWNKKQKKQNIKNVYNKWYIEPKMRFANPKVNTQQQDIKSLTKYVNKFFSENNRDVAIKLQYAPILLRETEQRLGRKPVICNYAQISRR